MASSQTTNYALPQWSKSDRIQMSDFNTAMSTIDAALAEKSAVVFGTYTGNGAASQAVSLPFAAKFVCVWPIEGERCNSINDVWSARATASTPQTLGYDSHVPCLSIAASGFTVYYRTGVQTRNSSDAKVYTNYGDEAYAYIAIG